MRIVLAELRCNSLRLNNSRLTQLENAAPLPSPLRLQQRTNTSPLRSRKRFMTDILNKNIVLVLNKN